MDDTRFDTEQVFTLNHYYYFFPEDMLPEVIEREVAVIWKLLDLRPGMEVLDLACGNGRITNALARRGCQAAGLDLIPAFLEQASQRAAAENLTASYHLGDMRALPWTNRFDSIINWMSAYGYFADEENRQVLREAYRALKPGGKLLLDLNNRELLLKNFQRASVIQRDGNYLVDKRRYDVSSGRVYTERLILFEGHESHMRFFVREFSYHELAAWLRQVGFQRVSGYDWEGQPFSLQSQRMIVVAEKLTAW
ncbi:MAG TPA: methyltransferase domain-containing protein [Ktedonobacterales bacterium]|jgi:SAM-dependent methyltransferase